MATMHMRKWMPFLVLAAAPLLMGADGCDQLLCGLFGGGNCGGSNPPSNPGGGISVYADFSRSAIEQHNCSVDVSGTSYNTAYGDSWRMLEPGSSSITVRFNLSSAPGSTTSLKLTHLSSYCSGSPGGGSSPIDIVVNGTVFKNDYDVAANHGGSHSMQTDQWTVATLLHSGANTVVLQYQNGASAHYWIKRLEISSSSGQTPSPSPNPPDDTPDCFSGLPNPVVECEGTETYQDAFGVACTRYNLRVTNSSAYPAALFEDAPDLPPCGTNTNAARADVNIYAEGGRYLYGFCDLESPSGLNNIWFGLCAAYDDPTPPDKIYITIEDRRCGTTWTSALASTQACVPSNDEIDGTSITRGLPQFVLTWEPPADLDLHVIDPTGAHIYFDNPGGHGEYLDDGVGDDPGGGPENVFYDPSNAPQGTYEVWVHYWDWDPKPQRSVPFTIWRRLSYAEPLEVWFTGTLSAKGQESQHQTMTYP